MEKYEYLTGEDLGHRPSVLEKTKFEYSPLGAVLADNVKKKTNTNKVNIKKDKTKIWYIIHNIALQSLKILMNLKNYHLILCTKNWMIFKKKFKAVNPQTNKNEVLKPKVLDNAGDLFNELYYIYKDRCNEEKDGLDTKSKKPFY